MRGEAGAAACDSAARAAAAVRAVCIDPQAASDLLDGRYPERPFKLLPAGVGYGPGGV